MKDLLPIGSVVTLKEGTKKLMIMGRFLQKPDAKELYDYCGCLWPEGYVDPRHCYLFNHEDIDCFYYMGMQDVEEFNYRFKLEEEFSKAESEGYKYASKKKG